MKAPKWLLQEEGLTQRQWKMLKRREIKHVIKALDRYRLGCAYTPGYEEVHTIDEALTRIVNAQSVKNWGR